MPALVQVERMLQQFYQDPGLDTGGVVKVGPPYLAVSLPLHFVLLTLSATCTCPHVALVFH